MVVSYDPLYFCVVSFNFFFIFNFIDLTSLSFFFFLVSLAKGLSILFIFSKNLQLLVSLMFAIIFFVSMSFISALVFIISFLPLTLGFACSSFSSCFRCNVRLFIWDFLVSWDKTVLLKTSLLVQLLLYPRNFGSLCFHFHLSLGIFYFFFDFFSDPLIVL